jgi:protein SCO1
MRALLLLVALAACGRARVSREPLATLPDFSMTAIAEGEAPFGLKQMLGRVWVADFIFTRCGGPCPLLSQRMQALSTQLPPQIGLLTVSVDPEGDTPERIRKYAKNYGADPRRWVFLRGTPEDTYRLMYAGFRQPLSVDPGAQPEARAMHSTQLVLVDRRGGIRGFYSGFSNEDMARLSADARRLEETLQ